MITELPIQLKVLRLKQALEELVATRSLEICALVERNRFCVFANTHEREAQGGFLTQDAAMQAHERRTEASQENKCDRSREAYHGPEQSRREIPERHGGSHHEDAGMQDLDDQLRRMSRERGHILRHALVGIVNCTTTLKLHLVVCLVSVQVLLEERLGEKAPPLKGEGPLEKMTATSERNHQHDHQQASEDQLIEELLIPRFQRIHPS
eukprot:CAMPEP_0180562736 /NCGR_PEP_ID=MMETSP1037_2-20121125/4080_1 /TAXON_ID=632150 /ORGANISM="Azadinium spinosum, Strain 3D9" /LENGTH=208 /DNA_ID=CAMNT_0022579477 /DNA_START=165 /DNA_END=791 /DNA_ORIENTATION=-